MNLQPTHIYNLLLQLIFQIENVNNSHFQIGRITGSKLALYNARYLKLPKTAQELTQTLRQVTQFIDDYPYEFSADPSEQLRYNSAKHQLPVFGLTDAQREIYCQFVSGLFMGCLYQLGCDCQIENVKYGEDVVFVVYLVPSS